MNDVLKTLDGNIIDPKIPRYDKEIYYQPGDVYQATDVGLSFSGFIYTSGTAIRFTIPLPKRIDKVSKATVNNLEVTVRCNGKYVPAGNVDLLKHSNFSQIVTKLLSNNLLLIVVGGKEVWANAVNNQVVTVSPGVNIKVTFS